VKVYIAGRITGNDNYKKQFQEAEELLISQGHYVLNPCKNWGFEYKEYIDMGLAELSKCDAIYMLEGWEESRGAILEMHYAMAIAMPVRNISNELFRQYAGIYFPDLQKCILDKKYCK